MDNFIKLFIYYVGITIISFPLHAGIKNFETLRLACFFHDTVQPHTHHGLLNTGLPLVWAKGMADEDIYISGYMEDGFFIIASIKGKAGGYFGLRLIANYENSLNLAEHFCARGLKYEYKDNAEHKEIVHMGAKSSLISVRVSPVLFATHVSHAIKTVNKMVVFGDSLSDQGNLKRSLKFFPNSPYFAGRFSDRLIWIDYVQQRTRIAVKNFAIGGSVSNMFVDLEFNQKTLGERTRSRAQNIIAGNLNDEVDKYKTKFLNTDKLLDPQGTLFSIWIGGNDYVSFMDSPTDVDTFFDQPDDNRVGYHLIVRRVIHTITNNIVKLYDLGARNFLIANMPDLGKLPRVLENETYHAKIYEPHNKKIFNLSKKLSQISEEHNEILQRELNTLKSSLADVNIIHVDVYNDLANIKSYVFNLQGKIINFNYDFDDEFLTNLVQQNQSITIYHACYNGNEFRAGDHKVCDKPHRSIFWDKLHPSSYTHCLIAAHIHAYAAEMNILAPTKLNDYLKICRPDLAHIND